MVILWILDKKFTTLDKSSLFWTNFHDLGFLKKKTQQKQTSNNKFMRNKYKYKDMRSKQLGNFKDGTLTISKNQIKKINAS